MKRIKPLTKIYCDWKSQYGEGLLPIDEITVWEINGLYLRIYGHYFNGITTGSREIKIFFGEKIFYQTRNVGNIHSTLYKGSKGEYILQISGRILPFGSGAGGLVSERELKFSVKKGRLKITNAVEITYCYDLSYGTRKVVETTQIRGA
jgi:hypothetical protein